jgi:hypothetical protein
MNRIKIILAGLMMLSSFGALAEFSSRNSGGGKGEQFKPYGEGLPMPWPFPWAKDCAVKWSTVSGRYLLFESDSHHEVELKISMVTQKGLRFMRISRFTSEGVMISDGLTPVTIDQRSVQVQLRPLTPGGYPVYASLKYYYDTSDFSCEMSRLVPILALTEKRPDHVTQVQYRLIRRPLQD